MSEPEHTFLFADLAGFTALTEAMGDESAAELVDSFYGAVRGMLAEHDAEEVKSIGDALLLRVERAAPGVRLGLRIVADVGAQHGFPAVRVGMHTGPAVERGGDWFGASVNLAARVSGAAGGGQVLLSETTQLAAGELDGVRLVAEGQRTFKNVGEPVMLYAAVAAGPATAALPIDPVCRMAVAPEHGVGMLRHQGVEFYFCSLACAARFTAEPDRYSLAG